MKNFFSYARPAITITVLLLVFFSGVYPLTIWGLAHILPTSGKADLINSRGALSYVNIGQKFVSDQYFWSRPSAVDYNAAGSGGSNKGPTDADYLATVAARIDSFLVHNPSIPRQQIPSELVTASGSGLDPDISVASAMVQVNRIAKARSVPEAVVISQIEDCIEHPLFRVFGPEKVNVLRLNIELDKIAKH